MRPNATRWNTTQRHTWTQLGIGAGALLLPPLALGAAFYAMLAPPDEDVLPPAQAAPDPRQPAVLPFAPVTVAGLPGAAQEPPPGRSGADGTRGPERTPPQGSPVRVSVAATVNPPAAADGSTAPPAADPPKRPPHRHPQRPRQDPSLLKTWLQDIGILPRNSNTTRGG